jgi:predicted ATPase
MASERSRAEGADSPISSQPSEDFVRQVRDSLRHLHDRARLQIHPLATLASPQTDRRAPGRGKRLQDDLNQAIEALRPDPGVPDDSPAVRRYQLLARRYVEGLEAVEVQQQLAIGKTEYYANHQDALEAVASLLWERWQPDGAGAPAQPSAVPVPPLADVPRPPPVLDDARRHDLPAQLTSFVGRERELAELRGWLTDPETRLVTLTGPGGVGKTRLALQVARALAPAFLDGLRFVDLTAVTEPDRMLPALAQTLELQESGERPIRETIRTYLRNRAMLIVLDNFERVLPGGPALTDLLASCPGLRFLVTSRVALRLRGEREIVLAPLAVPDRGTTTDLSALERNAAVRLFITRAREARPDFALTAENGPAVAEICRRLDGLPLAIELAAARIKVFPASLLLARLENRLKTLTGGPRDLPERQQTLRATIGWSYDLLEESERALFRRLSVFVGGFGLEAAESVGAVGNTIELDAIDGIESLVTKSLVREQQAPVGTVRFAMLDTIREFALDALAERGELAAIRAVHAQHVFQIVTSLENDLTLFIYATHLADLEPDDGNLTAAIGWAEEQGEIDVALRIAAALGSLWASHGRLTEARTLLERLLGQSRAAESAMGRARALHILAGVLSLLGEPLAMFDPLAEALPLSRRLGDRRLCTFILHDLWWVGPYLGQWTEAEAYLAEALEIGRDTGDDVVVAWALNEQGIAAFWFEHDLAKAHDRWSKALAVARSIGARGLVAEMLNNLGLIAWQEGDLAGAQRIQQECLEIRWGSSDWRGATSALDCLAAIAVDHDDVRRALVIGGAVARWRAETGASYMKVWQDLLWAHVERARQGSDVGAEAWSVGQTMTLEQAVEYALESD